MKKLTCALVAILVTAILCIPSFATSILLPADVVLHTEEDMLSVAFMDLSQADIEMTNQIIAAREEIIFSHSWVADGLQGWVLDEDGNVIEEVPQFSDLFPANWEIPTRNYSITQADLQIADEVTHANDQEMMFFYNGTLTLNPPSASTITPAFCSFSTTGWAGYLNYNITHVCTSAICQVSDHAAHTYNVGYTNANTGQSLGWKTGLNDGESFSVTTPPGIEVAVRASMDTANSTVSGNWYVQVYGAMDILND